MFLKYSVWNIYKKGEFNKVGKWGEEKILNEVLFVFLSHTFTISYDLRFSYWKDIGSGKNSTKLIQSFCLDDSSCVS